MQASIRIIAAALLAALLAAPALADPEAVDRQACSESCAPPLEGPASDSDDTTPTEARAADTDELEDPSERQQPVIYVPPSRGSAQARVGGANRGGQHPL